MVLIAPALRLKDLLSTTFDSYGLPGPVYRTLIDEYGDRFGYDIRKDDPHLLLPAIRSGSLIIHDQGDRMVPYEDSRDLALAHPGMRFCTTCGLGHKRILQDGTVAWMALDFLAERILRRG
jgi:hypothetical protein